MISILIYGRNDAYGAGLQRRAALSINSMAAALTHVDDEIVFVDYNTDDDLCTFPELIADTLTVEARARLRVIRVRPRHHLALAGRQAPGVIESIARNIGLRRTRPENAWILSTNTDVILTPWGASLTAALEHLEPAYHGAPRFEAPRMLWESLDRTRPQEAVRELTFWAQRLHLAEVVRHDDPAIAYDAPGDFQLAPRDALFHVRGFDETMLQAWHVDANLAVRLGRLFGPARTVGCGFAVYHCEHTASTTSKHTARRQDDAFVTKVELVAGPVAPNTENWGAADINFECFHLSTRQPEKVFAAAASDPTTAQADIVYGPSSFRRVTSSRQHVLPYLVDRLAQLRRDTTVGWIGVDPAMRDMTQASLRRLGFTRPFGDIELDSCEVVIVDGPAPETERDAVDEFWHAFVAFTDAELRRSDAGTETRRVIGVNAVHNDLEAALLEFYDPVMAPFTTRLRPARIRARSSGTVDWTSNVIPDDAGVRDGDGIQLDPLGKGYVFTGPRLRLAPGDYVARLLFEKSGPRLPPWRRQIPRLVFEAVMGDVFLAQVRIATPRSGSAEYSLSFTVPREIIDVRKPALEVRLWSDEGAEGRVGQLLIAPAGS